LPDPGTPHFEDLAAECIRRRLEAHGPAPWSICEARLGDGDYQRLSDWATTVAAARLYDAIRNAGLVLLAFVSEWNRRNSPGGSVWVGLPPLFGVESTRRTLFTWNDQPTSFVRRTLRRTCERFQLRHAFATEQDEDLPYYLSVQLQYGFSLPHARSQLGNWLCGHRPPEVALRLLEPEGFYRSASFRRLVRDMKSYRRNYLPELDFRLTLRENPWVLPAWENEIVTLIGEIPKDGDDDEPEFRLLSDPRVTWEYGPEVRCRVCDLPDRLTAPRYLLRCAGHDIARYYRDHSGQIEADRRDAQIPLDGPEAVVTLETPDGEAVDVQTIRLWDPDVVAQVRPLGRETEDAVERLLPGEQVLITTTEAVVMPAPSSWRVLGPRERRWRWWLLDGTERVRVEDGGLVWDGEPPPPPPAWTNGVSVSLERTGSFFRLGELVRFRINAAPGVEVTHAACASQPLSFANTSRRRTSQVRVRAEMSGRCRLRVGVARGGDSAVVHDEVSLPVRAVTWADGGGEIPRNEPFSCFEAMNRPVRLLGDGPAVLIEGREILGPLPTGRAARIKRVLGTGKQLLVADSPFNTTDHFLLAQSAVDTGFARSLEREGKRFRLGLFRSLPPGDRRRLFLWSPTDGMTILGGSEIFTEEGGRAWVFHAPWETDTLLAAIAFEGRCLAAAWCGQERRFYDPHATDGADPLTRIALIRWCRLPGLRPDPDAQQLPLTDRLACFPMEMVRVALLDDGLPADLELEFEDRQSPRGELFNVIFREAYVRPAQGKVEEVFTGLLPKDFDRLMTYHPFLGCRALQAVLSRLVQQSKQQTRALLVAMQLQLLSLGGNAGEHDMARREGELRSRARSTFSENGEPIDDSEWRKLVEPIMRHLFTGVSMDNREEDNLRTALGVAPFREYLAARIIRRLLDQLP
jgi:hypothetical protein